MLDQYAPQDPPPIVAMLEIPRGESPQFESIFQKTATYVADRITSGGVAALEETIDALLVDTKYHDLHRNLTRAIPWSAVQRVMKAHIQSSVPEVPALVAHRVELALRLEQEVVRCMFRMAAFIHLDLSDAPPKSEVGDIFLEHHLPSKMRDAGVAYRAGEVCGIALSSGGITSNELADALVERWLHGVRTTVAMSIAMLRSVDPRTPDVDPQLLPRSYHVDFDSMFEEHHEAQRGLAIALDEVDRTGTGYPLEDTD